MFDSQGTNGFGKEQIQIDLIVIDPAMWPGLGPGEVPVVEPPRLTSTTRASQGKVERREGGTLRLHCGVTGIPEPEVTALSYSLDPSNCSSSLRLDN